MVSPLQSAFIPGRWIAESSILTQELVHTINTKKGKGGLMAIKLDMHKAFDRIEWGFLEKVLRCNGFDSQVSGLIMICVSTVSYSVLLNGVPQKKLYPKRGLRQGDPLSPFLFLLCHEAIAKIVIDEVKLVIKKDNHSLEEWATRDLKPLNEDAELEVCFVTFVLGA
uniref:Reverse transcriptase domain-containing protein n=1 Tax=Cannabis sativa TaxID=3483 RepID=A0A803QLK0_CANSA